MISCKHENCGMEKRLWLPMENHYSSEIALHKWCIRCGLVKIISDSKPNNLGFWMNILSKISKRYNLKDVQKRLIAKSLEAHEYFNDIYCINSELQKILFKKIVSRYCLISEDSIDSFLY